MTDPAVVPVIVQMGMSMNEKPRLVTLQYTVEHLKPPMRQVLPIVQPKSGGMCQQNVNPLAPQKLKTHFPHPCRHFFLCILVFPCVIPHGAAQDRKSVV